LTALLVDVHGQHEHQALMNPQTHLSFLDSFGDGDHRARQSAVATRYAAYHETQREIERLTLSSAERERRLAMLTDQIAEIEALRPKIGEDEKLRRRNVLFENAQKLSDKLRVAYESIYAMEGRSLSAQENLRRASEALRAITGIDERFDAMQAKVEELYYAVQDIGYELQDAKDSLEYDPVQAERTADRLNALEKLKRKYGPELSDVLDYLAKAKAQRDDLSEGDDKVQALKAKSAVLEADLRSACDALSESRLLLAERLREQLLMQLRDLGMAKTRFEARITKRRGYSADGADDVEFLLSPNPGEPLKPLAAIASGGELSRIMLALKAIEADADGVDSMIFDEIDTGVSGRMAQAVGEKMAAIARKRQVICVTHLPQIAALANNHYVVEKTVQGERTGSTVRALTRAGRIEELARMVGGAGDAMSGIRHATFMLDAAQALIASPDPSLDQ
jgi:DNA repair protein RecN (Recombination protein N)